MFIGDNIKNKITVSSCNCDIHMTCLQQRQSVTNPYCSKMVDGVTIFEWLPERRNCPGFCQEFSLMLFSITIWCSMLIACGMKAVGFFLEANDQNAFPNGIVMTIIVFSMAAILWLWLIIFSSIWKRIDMVIRKNKNYLNVTEDINSAFAV
ncbi:uncharacterized protein LOC111038478 [Myzus persicae]|uniref:uncharacterized protein LOC111038478 n=1 Tax=Myzus persicae TaxID=13164 RepID=UPI000B9342BC|nr:uncharacterized protein LOC111038478 [Myzus persicae]